MSINNQFITEKEYDAYAQFNHVQMYAKAPDDEKKLVLESLLDRELLFDAAKKQKWDSDKNYLEIIEKNKDKMGTHVEEYKKNLLIQILIKNLSDKKLPKDAELKKIYEKESRNNSEEIQVRHILVASKTKAEEIIKKITDGASFQALAKDWSIDVSGRHEGDLGWISKNIVPDPFLEAAKLLKNGQSSAHPLKTEWGFHIIQRVHSRPLQPFDFDKVKTELKNAQVMTLIQKEIQSLRDQAKIKIF